MSECNVVNGLEGKIKSEVHEANRTLYLTISNIDAANIKENSLNRIDFDLNGKGRLKTGELSKELFNLDQQLAGAAGRVIKAGLEQCPGMSRDDEHKFRMLVLKAAFNQINPESYPERVQTQTNGR